MWKLGCAINYSVDPRAEADYGPNIATALEDIHIAAGFGFTKLGWGDSRASFRFSVADDLQGAIGWASSTGDVSLLAEPNLPHSPESAVNSMLRDQIVIHETLHELGLDHDSTEVYETADEMMFPISPWGRLTFGAGDREGMAYVSALNGCVAPDPAAQPTPTVPLVNVASPAQPTVTSVPDAPVSTPVTDMSTPTRPTALERCLANLGLRAKTVGHYCPPLKTEAHASRGSPINHRRLSPRHARGN